MKQESGYALVLVVMAVPVLLSFVAFVIDVGNAFRMQRTLQYGTDAASLAAVLLLDEATHTDALVSSDVIQTLNDNGFSSLNSLSTSCGIWDESTQAIEFCGGCTGGTCPACTDCSDTNVNAIMVGASVGVSTYFAKLFGITSLFPAVSSTAYLNTVGISNCIRPFAVEFQIIDTLAIGDFFTVGNNEPANWGKVDLGINSSSGKSFEEAMLTNTCESEYEVGNTLSPGTGFGGPIRNVFDQIIDQGKQDMEIALVSPFPNGNSDVVTLLEFAKVRFHYDNGKNGQNWSGTFEVLERNITPPTGGASGGISPRMLVQ